MPAIVCANTYQVSLSGTFSAHNWTNVFHVEKLGGSPPDVTDAAQAVADAWNDNFGPHLCTAVEGTSISYIDLDSSTGESGSFTWTGSAGGGDTAAPATGQVCYLISWTASGGRRYRNGRSYLPGVAENATNDDGTVVSGKAEALGEDAGGMIADLFAADLQLCVVSYDVGTNEWFPRSISSGACDSRTATQRRRNR